MFLAKIITKYLSPQILYYYCISDFERKLHNYNKQELTYKKIITGTVAVI